MISVCMGYTDRHPACLGSCPKYLDARAAYEKQKKAREKDLITNDMLDSVHFTGLKYERNRR